MNDKTKLAVDIRLLKALHAFGYPHLKMEEVEAASKAALAGEDPGADVIKMLVKDWLQEAKVIPKD